MTRNLLQRVARLEAAQRDDVAGAVARWRGRCGRRGLA